MCGRFTLAAQPADLARAFPWAPPCEEIIDERYNVAPTTPVLALTEQGWRSLRWGLVPHWAKDPHAIGARYINARLETLAEKPLFREYYAERRCLIPANGFFEWKREGKCKTPFFVHSARGPLLALAGIWAGWGKGDERLYTCCVLTRPAAGPVALLHDRMPVVLGAALQERWLHEPIPADELPEVPLVVYQVSDYVNNARHEGAGCLTPVPKTSPDRLYSCGDT